MTLREWLEEAAAKGYPMRAHWRSQPEEVSAHDMIARIARTDAATLDESVTIVNADELFRDRGLRVACADVPDGRRWARLEPHPDNAR
jgi:hypothetical protein